MKASKVESNVTPGIKVSSSVDSATGALVATNRPVLLESAGALDGGSVSASAGVDVVDRAVDVDLALLCGTCRRVVGSKVLHDVVLDERVASPAVDGKVAVAVGIVGARVVDGPWRQGLVYRCRENI